MTTEEFRFERFDHAKHAQLEASRKAEANAAFHTAVAVAFWIVACAAALGLAVVWVAGRVS